ncbi:hypothetical protein C8R46DRAFT_1027471 [Mycena filopes]|nr:hypothetical protein C8R46DRAFT_1027471 [Mycena filopes]
MHYPRAVFGGEWKWICVSCHGFGAWNSALGGCEQWPPSKPWTRRKHARCWVGQSQLELNDSARVPDPRIRILQAGVSGQTLSSLSAAARRTRGLQLQRISHHDDLHLKAPRACRRPKYFEKGGENTVKSTAWMQIILGWNQHKNPARGTSIHIAIYVRVCRRSLRAGDQDVGAKIPQTLRCSDT